MQSTAHKLNTRKDLHYHMWCLVANMWVLCDFGIIISCFACTKFAEYDDGGWKAFKEVFTVMIIYIELGYLFFSENILLAISARRVDSKSRADDHS